MGILYIPIALLLFFIAVVALFRAVVEAIENRRCQRLFEARRRHAELRRQRLATIRNLHDLNPTAFEEYVGMLFQRSNYQVEHTGQAGDRGVDLMVTHPNGTPCIVQCKRYSSSQPIGPATIRELYGTMMRDGMKIGYLVTTSRFTEGARQEAQAASRNGHKIRLVDGDLLARKIRKLGLQAKAI